ncbi:MAG: hypothetical protein HWD57_04170 [Candidatus Accumulibacter cognatus]|uniref:Uncharacterized protein n=1 Tax=Candidatus Accumulibacter cognatus TaxID=2954383 RepID=A0A7D5S8S0_9PROT|nr:MAG: hypothetical protein HWD57_04170 [Candidatus Accumulibacter cognatus]
MRCLVFSLAPLAGDRHQAPLDTGLADRNHGLPAARHLDHATASPTGCQCAASPSIRRHLLADRPRALHYAGAVVASCPAFPIERTKTRTNCQ